MNEFIEIITAVMEESPVKTILTGLRAYLHNNLRIDESFISSLSAAGLLSDSDADILRSSVSQGGHKAQDGLLQYMHGVVLRSEDAGEVLRVLGRLLQAGKASSW